MSFIHFYSPIYTKDGKINGIKQTIKIASATLNKCVNEQAFVHKMIKLYTVIEKKAKINVLYRFFLKKKISKNALNTTF